MTGPADFPESGRSSRAQSHVVGVTLLLGITVIGLTGLTVAVGTVVQENAATADANRVATDLAAALEPVETTGQHTGEVSFAGGRLRTVERDLRVLNGSGVVRRVPIGGLVFESRGRRVATVADAVVRGRGERAWLRDPPPITASRDAGVLIVSAARLNASDVAVGGDGTATVSLDTRVTHERTALGNGTYRVAVETTTPEPLERWFRSRGATVTRRDFDGDGVPSVVGRFPGERVGYLVVHDQHLEVSG
jgi:DNA-binding transcriptional ArsR family regulator